MKTCLALLFSGSALALRIPVQRRAQSHRTSVLGISSTPYSSSSLTSVGTGASNESDIYNSNNMFYSTNLTIAGVEVPLQLDTGSTDLWIYPSAHPGLFTNVHNFTDVPVGVRYGKGSVQGYLAVTNASFVGFDVADQAFIAVTQAQDMDSLFAKGAYGIMGLGFDTLSNVVTAVQTAYNATWGRSLLSNLFLQDPNTPNHIAFALERAGDMDDMAEGAFDVGEILPQYAAIEQSPPIPLWPEDANRWTVLLDGMTVNGATVPLNSTFEGDNASDPPEGKSLALLDTGASLGLIPRWAVDAIYGRIPGSVYSPADDVWLVPCMGEANVAFTIGGITVPIHPLDLTIPGVYTLSTGENVTFCVNAFMSLTIDALPFDFLLGDSFLRNVYAVYDFGDFDTAGNMGKPYVKLLPLTDATTASAGFKKNRAATMAQLPPEGDATKLDGVTPPVPPNSATAGSGSSPSSSLGSGSGSGSGSNNLVSASSTDDSNDYSALSSSIDKITKFAPIALALLGLNAVLLIGLVALGACFFVKQRKQRGTSAVVGGGAGRGVYAPVTAHKFPDADEDERAKTPGYDIPRYRDGSS